MLSQAHGGEGRLEKQTRVVSPRMVAVQVLLNGFALVLRGPGSLWQVDTDEVLKCCVVGPLGQAGRSMGERREGRAPRGRAARSLLGGPPGGGGPGANGG